MATQRRGKAGVCLMAFDTDFPYFLAGELVRRGGRGTTSGGHGDDENEASGWGSPAEKDLDRPDQDEGYEGKNEDSKAVRLTLMEEVLLLGIKDREVSWVRWVLLRVIKACLAPFRSALN